MCRHHRGTRSQWGEGRQGLAPVLEEQTHGGDECVTGAFLEKQWDGRSEEVPTQAGVMVIQEGFLEEVAAEAQGRTRESTRGRGHHT